MTLTHLRPLPLFLGLTPNTCLSPTAYAIPSSASSLRSNFNANMAFFLTNYTLILLLNALIISLSHPIMLLMCSLVSSLWYLHRVTVNVPLPPPLSPHLTPFRRTVVLLAATLYVFLSYCMVPLLAVLGVTAAVCGAHAAGRNAGDIKAKTGKEDGGMDDRGMIDV
ncbi:hypothetical protein TrRE_jg10081 [Triparma retinervis]|uniref:PRA1 family protein n=1 Tax=Triparma retinervis TaxID=2557542 RepID=A0A9W7AEU2_9STRA|nr:hypothetical protein TrRE_jg10081 [Triparma retinervis]